MAQALMAFPDGYQGFKKTSYQNNFAVIKYTKLSGYGKFLKSSF